MIRKLNKPLEQVVFGLYGMRSNLIEGCLKERGLTYRKIDDLSDGSLDEVDLFVETGVYNIIPKECLTKPKLASLGFHETPLPEGKGWAPIRWTIENNKKHLVISLYELNEKLDDGGIVYQVNVPLTKEDYYSTLETKRQEGIKQCFDLFLDELSQGFFVVRPQTGQECFSKRRYKRTSELNTKKTLEDLWDDIRVCDVERYPPYFIVDNLKVVLKYEITRLDEI